MTVICCWWDESFGRRRITMLADTRISVEVIPGIYKPIDDTAIKLFRLRVRAHNLSSLDPATGAYRDPYFETEIGLGYSGYSTEALNLVAQISRCLEALVDVNDAQSLPDHHLIVKMIAQVVERYFVQHREPKTQVVDMLICGYSTNEMPWLTHVSHRRELGAAYKWLKLSRDDFYVVGSLSMDAGYRKSIVKTLREIRAQRKRVKDSELNPGLPAANLDVQRNRVIQRETLDRLRNSALQHVGGILQKMEVYCDGQVAVVAFTKDRWHAAEIEMIPHGNFL